MASPHPRTWRPLSANRGQRHVGRTPSSARDPLVAPLRPTGLVRQADQGVGCGPGGPPYWNRRGLPRFCSLVWRRRRPRAASILTPPVNSGILTESRSEPTKNFYRRSRFDRRGSMVFGNARAERRLIQRRRLDREGRSFMSAYLNSIRTTISTLRISRRIATTPCVWPRRSTCPK